MAEIINITWADIISRINKLDKTKKYYGVPRGGCIMSAMLNPVDTPEEADIIIDDLIDSGNTEKRYQKYNKEFIGLFNKQTEPELHNKWLVFPWETDDQKEIEDYLLRIAQRLNIQIEIKR